MKYAVIYEKSKTGYGAYTPDLPGCAAVGRTLAETKTLIEACIEMHLAGMRKGGEPIPEPTTEVGYAEVARGMSAGKSKPFGTPFLPDVSLDGHSLLFDLCVYSDKRCARQSDGRRVQTCYPRVEKQLDPQY